MKKILLGLAVSSFLFACSNDKKDDEKTSTMTSEKKMPVELLWDSTLTESVKASMTAFEKADIDGFTAGYDDNAKFYWSGGDSLIGKQAIKDYYNNRWKLINTLKFSNQIFLPVMAHEAPAPDVQGGKWMLHWYQVNVEYKNGKKIMFWAHNVSHYNDAGKIDNATQYIDRAPLMEATKDLMNK
jgi:hypothetical protein